jgi:polyphosphate kinase
LDSEEHPFLADGAVYLVTEVWLPEKDEIKSWAPSYGFVRVPSPPLSRFVSLPHETGEPRCVMFLDDVIRYNIDRVCDRREVGRAYPVTLTRDAELYIEEVFEGDLHDAIRTSLAGREKGAPTRLLYDMRSPYVLVHQMQHTLSLTEEDLMIGGHYHNLSDYMEFPRFDREDLSYPDWPSIPHPRLDGATTIIEEIRERDEVVHTPYQSFDHVVRFIEEAAKDPDVEEMWLTVYRVARDSAFLNALLEATAAGKKVVTFMELQARFDEESNLRWSDRLEAAGATVLYPTAGLKVHAKIALVVRRESQERKLYAYVGTGNFNEKTARVYADHGILTADERITRDVERVFAILSGDDDTEDPGHLLVARRTLRTGFYELIEQEAAAARRGEPSGMILKMNALEDEGIIERLYDASRAGVPIQIIVRGICRLVPGIPGQSETIEVRSIVDRYLEHARVYVFHGTGAEKMFIASADWMTRNLSKRVEVAVPVYDEVIRRQIRTMLELQLADNTKARIIDAAQSNRYFPQTEEAVRAQEAFRDFLRTL